MRIVNYDGDRLLHIYDVVKNLLICLIILIFKCLFKGHMQQGGSPTPFDRNMGTKQAAKCVEWLVEKLRESTRPDGTIYTINPDTAAMMGVIRRQYRFTPLTDLVPLTNFE